MTSNGPSLPIDPVSDETEPNQRTDPRWRLLFVLATVGLVTSVLALIVLLARGVEVIGDTDARLEEVRSFTQGEVLALSEAGWPLPEDLRRAEFRFRHGGQDFEGSCFVPASTTVGPCTIEFVPSDPTLHRVRDGRHDPVEAWTHAVFGFVLLPSLAVLGLLLRRRALTRLDTSSGEPA